MYFYRRLFTKDEKLLKNEILYDFMVLEKFYRTNRGEIRQVSLHCKYDFFKNRDDYYKKEFYIYLRVEQISDDVLKFVNRYGFEEASIYNFTKDLVHLLGNYGSTMKAIDGFIP